MKILKHKNIMGIIYGILLLMPFLSILARSAYVVVNKNAYQSYSGYNIETNTELATNIESGLDYQFSFNNYSGNVDMPNEVKVDNVYIASGYTSLSTFYAEHGNEIEYIRIYMPATSRRIYFYDNEMNTLNYFSLSISQNNFISFTAKSNGILNDNDIIYKVSQQQVGNSLDNVFEYSVSQFIEDNNFGKVNLFNWFTDLFLDDNAHNNMYVHYINWYLNYSMLVSCMHLLFLVLMWFVNYSKRLLDRGMNYDW